MNDMTPIETTLKDWETDQEVRWCPGCGDYAILKAVQRTLPQLGSNPANTVFVSGIGCSSRFPVLRRKLRLPHDPRPRAGFCHWHQAGQPGPRRVDGDRRR